MPKKPPIRAELRWEWLRRSEENDESPPMIAAKDKYDVRTVRKQIELAREEREMREARTVVLRNAVEKHYDDLRRFAERMNSEITGNAEVSPSPDDDLFESALRQHLPRSPIWSYAPKRTQLKNEEDRYRGRLEESIKKRIHSSRELAALESAGLAGIADRVIAILQAEYPEWLGGDREYTLTESLRYEPRGEGLVAPVFSTVPLALMKEEVASKQMPVLCRAIRRAERSVKTSHEYLDLARTAEEVRRLDARLRDELAVIRLRRIIPGRCRFCPI